MSSANYTGPKGLHIGLWVVQILLAALFIAAGIYKVTTPGEALLAAGMTAPTLALKISGVAEFFGGIGLILPTAFRIQPKLTPIAAALLAFVMVLAIGTHIILGEFPAIVPPLVLGLLCSFVAWGRFTKVVVTPA